MWLNKRERIAKKILKYERFQKFIAKRLRQERKSLKDYDNENFERWDSDG